MKLPQKKRRAEREKVVRRSHWRWGAAVEISRHHGAGGGEWAHLEGRRLARDHGGAVEGPCTGPKIAGGGVVVLVLCHVVAIRPCPELRIIYEIVPRHLESVAVPGAQRIRRGGDSNALVERLTQQRRSADLTDQPAIGEPVIEHNWISGSVQLAGAAKARPERCDRNRAQQGRAFLVPDLEMDICDLDVVIRPGGAIDIRRRIAARGKVDPFPIGAGGRHLRRRQQRALHYRIRPGRGRGERRQRPSPYVNGSAAGQGTRLRLKRRRDIILLTLTQRDARLGHHSSR